jgi:GT2 family glycosyltransferase
MRTAVILVTFNGWEMTRNCLNDMAAQLADSEHFVVAIADNASSDDTVKNIRKEFPTVHVYPSSKNLGFGAANNLAIKGLLSDGESFDSICLLNNDTRLNADTLPRLQKAWEKAEAFARESGNAYAVIAPSTKNKDGSDQPNYFAGLGPEGIGSLKFFTNALRNEEGAAEILQGKPSKTAQENLLETNWLSGVCWMFGKELYESLTTEGSFFDEKIFMYYEDADLALRARKIGARFFIANDITLTHLGGGSAQSNTSRALQHDRAQQYVFKKHFGIKGLLLSKGFRILRSSVRIASAIPRIGSSEKRKYLEHHMALLKAALW